ncbi:MAG: hypothetical protein QW336_01405 [Candidatus Anstonellales archaeon]
MKSYGMNIINLINSVILLRNRKYPLSLPYDKDEFVNFFPDRSISGSTENMRTILIDMNVAKGEEVSKNGKRKIRVSSIC